MRIAALILLLLASCCSMADDHACPTDEIVVTAVDQYGAFVANLAPTNFQAEAHGQKLPILSSGVHIRPGRVVILLDVSGSMRDPESTPRIAATEAVRSLRPSTQIALMAFADETKPLATFGASRESLIQVLRAMDWNKIAKGPTALLDAILAAVKLLDPPQLGDAIYVITDGGDNKSHAHISQVETTLLAKGIRLFVFLVAPSGPPSPEESAGAQEMGAFASATGGWLLVYRSAHSLVNPWTTTKIRHPSPAQPLYDQLNNFYTLRLGGLPSLSKPEKWKLEVRGDKEVDRKNVKLHYPARLLPCQSGLPAR